MKVLIMSGGTGSKQLQSGLYSIFKDNLEVKLLINCYDNGGTTGVVRQVFDGKILGPSDLKKNQFFRHFLTYGNTDLLKFLEERITSNNPYEEIQKVLSKYSIGEYEKEIINNSIDFFFSKPLSKVIDYEDFSISSLIYAGLAGANNNSTSKVGEIMSKVLKIDDFIIINDDESLFLNAVSNSDQIIDDEGDIVKWNNDSDTIKSVWLENVHGVVTLPLLTELAKKEISEADMIIFSSGTQWSSLIPTYMSVGFKEAIEKSKAKKYLVMNCFPDKDMTGIGSKELIPNLEKYLPLKDITTIFSENAEESMRYYPEFNFPYICANVSEPRKLTHKPYDLIKCIFNDYYKDYLGDNKYYVFDWDGTIRSRIVSMSNTTNSNISKLSSLNEFSIITGNDISVINSEIQEKNNVMVFADGGNNLYEKTIFKKYISKDVLIESSEEIFSLLNSISINRSKIHNRNNCTISIKPIDPEYRIPLCLLINKILPQDFIANITGKTTIDITKKNLNKEIPLKFIKDLEKISNKEIVYLGDEYYENGNDYIIFQRKDVKFLKINNVKDTNVFLTILKEQQKNGF